MRRIVYEFHFISDNSLTVYQGLVDDTVADNEEALDKVFELTAREFEKSKRFAWLTDQVTKRRYLVNTNNVNIMTFDLEDDQVITEEIINAS